MMGLRIFNGSFVVILLVVNCYCDVVVKPTKLWQFLDANDEMLQQRFTENIDEFSVGRIKCLRYCIKSKDEMPGVLHLIWKFGSKEMRPTSVLDKDFTPQIMQGKSIKSDDSENMHNECTFSIVTGCKMLQLMDDNVTKVEKSFIQSLQPNLQALEDSDNYRSSALNFVNEKLIDQSKLAKKNEVSFYVRPNQAELNIVVLGNISKIDLKMPVARGMDSATVTSAATTEKVNIATASAPRLMLAQTTRTPSTGVSEDDSYVGGLKLNVLNPPPGGWRLSLQGMTMRDDETYRLVVTSAVVPEFTSADYDIKKAVEDQVSARNLKDIRKVSGISSRQLDIFNESEDMKHEFSPRMLATGRAFEDQNEQNSFKFPSSETDFESIRPNITMRMDVDQIEDRTVDRTSHDLEDLNRSLYDELPIKKPLIVELNPNTNLVAYPNTVHRVIFDITNNHILPVRHFIQPRSSLPIVGIAPWPLLQPIEITPGQTFSVAVDVRIPPTVAESVSHTVSLQVQGRENIEKSANIFVKSTGSRILDDVKPYFYFSFNNNCAGRTSAEKCLKSYWSVDITVQDSESGLKSVTSSPKGIYPRSQYSSGTSSPVYFYYSNNCCNRIVEVTATDVSGNVYSKRIDVGEWYNLTEGEIAAVVIGVLFIILLIILIVITILYCSNRRKSHDLPYSQRYGSRSGPSGRGNE